MALRGVTFAGQNVTPKNDGALYNAHNGDGILNGCEMSFTTSELVIQSGHIIAGGRVCQIDGATRINAFDISGGAEPGFEGYIQIVLECDTSQPVGFQWSLKGFKSASISGFATLTKEDINGAGTLYQLELAVLQLVNSDITAIYRSLGNSLLVTKNYISFQDGDGDRQAIVGSVDDSYAYIGKLSNGSIESGIRLFEAGTSGVVVYSHGKEIVLRPNGASDSSGQVYISTAGNLYVTGDVHRTPTTKSGSQSSSKSVAVGNEKILTITNIPAGVYMIVVNYRYRCTIDSGSHIFTNLYKSASASGTIMYSGHALNKGTEYINDATYATFGANGALSLYLEPTTAGTVDACTVSMISLALL